MATPQETLRILRRLLATGVTSRVERLLARIHPADLGQGGQPGIEFDEVGVSGEG